MADRRPSFSLRWFFLLLLAEIALFVAIYYLRLSGEPQRNDAPPAFSSVQRLNLQSLINAKGYSCPRPPTLRYEQRSSGVIIVATCGQPDGDIDRFVIDFKGHVRKD